MTGLSRFIRNGVAMMDITLLIFLLVYVAMAVGTLPGFKVDRSGAAVVGALAMISLRLIAPKAAWDAIDYRSVGMLFGLMVVSAAFVVSGFYAQVAHRVATLNVSPSLLLAILITVAGGLSSILTNDVVVVAMTPLLVSITIARGLNPIPFLLGFCFAANTGSAGTLMGSPHNMIAAQELQLSFMGFLKVAGVPAILSLPIIWGVVNFLYRGRWTALPKVKVIQGPEGGLTLDKGETIKAAAIAAAIVVAFVASTLPRELIALGGAALLLVNRRIASSDLMKHVDGNLLLLVMGLFVVNAAMASTDMPQHLLNWLKGAGLDLNEPIMLFLVSAVLSNVVGNNATVMLLVPLLDPASNRDALGAALALGTGFSSSLVVFGSLAGIIVVEQAAVHGVKISFKEFSRSGVPAAILCMGLAASWIGYQTL